ncbi:MAG TPA: protein tyrosine kinase [Woeseiaceae bacterium]|nr:protein tyrosine kinase [Woeseiaceae bacterium]
MSKIQEALKQIKLHQRTESLEPTVPDLAKLVPPGEQRAGSLKELAAGNPPVRIDVDALREEHLIVPQEDWQLLSSQLREIKRPLLGHAFGKRATKIEDGNFVMITSALAGEGKTFISLNLALSITHERDHAVLLIDNDVLKPRLTQAFDATERVGLLDYLENPELELGSIVYPTSVQGLYFVPAGEPRMNSTELLSGSRMDGLVDQLRYQADGQVVLFDAPPVLETTEAKVVGALVGQIVLVVRADKTPQSAVVTALSVLGSAKPVNLLLNQMSSRSLQSRYAYGLVYREYYPDPQGADTLHALPAVARPQWSNE